MSLKATNPEMKRANRYPEFKSPAPGSFAYHHPVIGIGAQVFYDKAIKQPYEQATGSIHRKVKQVASDSGIRPALFSETLYPQFASIFSDTVYENPDFQVSLSTFREDYNTWQEEGCPLDGRQEQFQQIADRMFTSNLHYDAYTTLGHYLFRKQDERDFDFGQKFQQDRLNIRDNTRPQDLPGTAYATTLETRKASNNFDTTMYANFPYLAATRSINGNPVRILQYGTPVMEWVDSGEFARRAYDLGAAAVDGTMRLAQKAWNLGSTPSAETSTSSNKTGKAKAASTASSPKKSLDVLNRIVTPEYRAFLDTCKSQNRKVLYCSLTPDRMQEIFELASDPQYTDEEGNSIFHFIKMPSEGFLQPETSSDGTNLEEYKEKIAENLRTTWTYDSRELSKKDLKGFVPGSWKVGDFIQKNHQKILNISFRIINETYQNEPQGLSREQRKNLLKEKKQALMMLFCTLLRTALVKQFAITDYNNTCAEGMGLGAMHSVSDLLFDSFLTDQLDLNQMDLRVLASWPAFMIKSKAVANTDAECLISFASFLEKAASIPRLKQWIIDRFKPVFAIGNIRFSNQIQTVESLSHQLHQKEGFSQIRKTINVEPPLEGWDRDNLHGSIAKAVYPYVLTMLTQQYPGHFFKNSQKSLDCLTWVEESDIELSGDMGYVDGDAISDLEGLNLVIGSQTSDGRKIKLADLGVSFKFTTAKEDLGKESLPVDLVIKANLRYNTQKERPTNEYFKEEKLQRIKLANQRKWAALEAVERKLKEASARSATPPAGTGSDGSFVEEHEAPQISLNEILRRRSTMPLPNTRSADPESKDKTEHSNNKEDEQSYSYRKIVALVAGGTSGLAGLSALYYFKDQIAAFAKTVFNNNPATKLIVPELPAPKLPSTEPPSKAIPLLTPPSQSVINAGLKIISKEQNAFGSTNTEGSNITFLNNLMPHKFVPQQGKEHRDETALTCLIPSYTNMISEEATIAENNPPIPPVQVVPSSTVPAIEIPSFTLTTLRELEHDTTKRAVTPGSISSLVLTNNITTAIESSSKLTASVISIIPSTKSIVTAFVNGTKTLKNIVDTPLRSSEVISSSGTVITPIEQQAQPLEVHQSTISVTPAVIVESRILEDVTRTENVNLEDTAAKVENSAEKAFSYGTEFSTALKITAAVVVVSAIAYASMKAYQYFISETQKKSLSPIEHVQTPQAELEVIKTPSKPKTQTFFQKIVLRFQSLNSFFSNLFYNVFSFNFLKIQKTKKAINGS